MSLLPNHLLALLADWSTPLQTPAYGPVCYKAWERKNALLRKTGMSVGTHAVIQRGFQFLTGYAHNISIGERVSMGMNIRLYNFNKIEIGSFCMFAGEIIISNGGHDTRSLDPNSWPLVIGRGCWFGSGVQVAASKAIRIGDNVIAGAGALIIDDVPDNSIVVGSPARIIKTRELPDRVWHMGNRYFNPRTFELYPE